MHIPHDSFFKAIFGDPAQAAQAIRAILPPRVAAHIDWDSLKAVHASFVDVLLKQRYGDLVFSARLNDGREAFLWLLFEHQSTVDHWMSWRMLRMAVHFLDAWRGQHPLARYVPAVIPIVLYNGDTPWNAPTSFIDLIDLSDDARRDFADYLLSYRLLIDDLPATADEDIDARALDARGRLALVVMKHSSSATLLLHLRAHSDDIRELLATEHGRVLWTFIVRYIVPINPHLDRDTIVRELGPAVGPQLSETMLTYQQMLEEDRKELYKEAHSEGQREGQRALLLRQLARRFGSLPETVTVCIDVASNSDIERWADRILDATSLDDVFSVP
jgi:predicted transposase YdaD